MADSVAVRQQRYRALMNEKGFRRAEVWVKGDPFHDIQALHNYIVSLQSDAGCDIKVLSELDRRLILILDNLGMAAQC